jgi:hypothetical protein
LLVAIEEPSNLMQAIAFNGFKVAAGDRVEPPPGLSDRVFQVVSITYKVSRDCLTTCKYVQNGELAA